MSRSSSTKRRHQGNQRAIQAAIHNICRRSGGKRQYPSRKRALSAMNYARAHTPLPTKPTAVYHCPHCKDWHLTSKEQRA